MSRRLWLEQKLHGASKNFHRFRKRLSGRTGLAKFRNLRLVLLGKAGTGKSTLGNLILKKNVFRSSAFASAATRNPISESAYIENRYVTVVDTPGLHSQELTVFKAGTAIFDSLQMLNPGPHAFIVVMKMERWRDEDEDTINFFKTMLGPDFLQHGIIMFTHEDQLNGVSVNDFIHNFVSHPQRRAFFDECGGRYLTVNCRASNEEMTTNIRRSLVQMMRLLSRNGKNYYKEDSRAYRSVFFRHAELYTQSRLTATQMQLLMQEQVVEKQRQLEEANKKLTRAKYGMAGVALCALGVLAAPQITVFLGGSASATSTVTAAAALTNETVAATITSTMTSTIALGGIITK